MKHAWSFDHRPDPVLGEALRRALDPGDGAAFVARVLARAAELRPGSAGSWDAVLARWARFGVAAAALIALAAGYAVGRAGVISPTPRSSVAEALLVRHGQAPDVEVVLASVMGN